MDQKSGQGEIMKTNENIHIISSVLKTTASENIVSAEELAEIDKPLKDILNGQTEKTTEQSERK